MFVPRKRAPHGGRRAAPAAVIASMLAILVAFAVTACGSSAPPAGHAAPSSPAASGSSGNAASNVSALCAASTRVDSLTVQRTDALPGDHSRFAFPAKEKASSAPQAQSVAHSLCGLQQVPRTAAVCPADFGVTYQLNFAAGTHHFAPVTMNPTGCDLVRGLGAPRAATSTTLWRTLGVAIGIPHPDKAAFSGTRATS